MNACNVSIYAGVHVLFYACGRACMCRFVRECTVFTHVCIYVCKYITLHDRLYVHMHTCLQ